LASGLSKVVSSHSAPKRAGFDVLIPIVEPAADGTKVDLSHVGFVGPELLLEIDGIFRQMQDDAGASRSVMKHGIVASEIRTTQTAARGITGTKLKIMGTRNKIYSGEKGVYPRIFDTSII
jgi:hypothetical protein